MTIDCFITTDFSRPYFLELTSRALTMSGFDVQFIKAPMLERYLECEKRAMSDIYILCDDDIIPESPSALKELVGIMKVHPEYSQLGFGWRKDMNSESDSSWIRNKEKYIWEMDHVGGCMAIRKGSFERPVDKPDYAKGVGDDRIMGEAARKKGFKVGIVPSLFFHHLGVRKSTVWK